MTIRQVAIMMLMALLIMPAAVHAHTLELLRAETVHGFGGGCHDVGSDADQDSTGDHQDDARCCERDTPYDLPSFRAIAISAVTGMLVCTPDGRPLDGHVRRIYKPPR